MAISPHSIRRFAGLFGSTNPFGRVPEGACSTLDNCVIRSSDVLEPRRGFKASASCGAPVNALAFKQGVAVGITYDNPGAGVTGTLRKYDPAADAWTSLPMNPGALTIDRPGGVAGVGTRFVSAQKALYFQSKYGLTKIEDISTGVCRPAISKPTTITSGDSVFGFTIGTFAQLIGPPGFLHTGNQVAYRFTNCRFGANGELIESEPSDRFLVTNSSGSDLNVVMSMANVWLVPVDTFIRVYRTKQAVAASEEYFLVKEVVPSQSQGVGSDGFYTPFGVSGPGGVVSVVDQSTDITLVVPLYTNAQTGGTTAIANAAAPLAADIAFFRNRMYCLNAKDFGRLSVRIIGAGTGGIVDGASFTLNGAQFVFQTTGYGFSPHVTALDTLGTATQNMAVTAQYLTGLTNSFFGGAASWGQSVSRYPLTSAVMVRYTSVAGDGSDAGALEFESVLPGYSFTFQTSSNVGWDRDYTAGTTASVNAQVAGLTWSNPGEPEAFPLANNTTIGDLTAAGQRIIALKESLFVFKADGLWKVTDDGSALGPLIQPIDPTIRLVAPETAVALDNFILALCDQGVVLISETGAVVNITHQQIERELLTLMARVGSSTLANLAFGVAYQPEHTYILSLPESSNATACTRQYVYNLQTQAWDSWTVPGVLCGAVHPDTGQLYFGKTDGTIWIERKNQDSSDYQDPGFTIASPSASAVATLVFSGDLRTGSTPFAVGDLVQQFQTTNALRQRVTAVSYSSGTNQTTVTLDAVPRYAWNQIVPLTVSKAIQCKVTFLPIFADEPLQDKEWADSFLSFRYCDLDFIIAGFTSEKYPIPSGTNPAVERINNSDGSLAPVTLQTWAPSPWGKTVWGRHAKDVILKATLPADVQGYSAQLTVSLTLPCAMSRFELSAIDVKIAGESYAVTR